MPAAAVTPAPIVYVKTAVVQLLVVVHLPGPVGPPTGYVSILPCIYADITAQMLV